MLYETPIEERASPSESTSDVRGVALPKPGDSPPIDESRSLAYRDRTFLLGSEIISSGGVRTRGYNPSLAYFCTACGNVWGRVVLGSGGWHSVSIRCRAHGGGSFLTPLLWWDHTNGKTHDAQLSTFPEPILRYEAEIRAFGAKGGLGL